MALHEYAVNPPLATVLDLEQKRAEYMGNPQVDDGHTRIANELLEQIISFPFSGPQQKVVLCVIRKTYGFQKKADHLAQSTISVMTGIARTNVSRVLKQLKSMNVLVVNTDKFTHKIELNKRYKEWKKLERNTYHSDTCYLSDTYHADTEIGITQIPKLVSRGYTQKKERNKERNTQEIPAGFVEFWDAYGKKVGKPNSIKEWKKINPDQELIDLILTAAKKLCADRPEAKYRKDPERWLKSRMWEDYAEETYTSWTDDPIFAGGI